MANLNELAGLKLTAIAAEALPVLQAKVPLFSLFSTDFSSDVAQIGSAVSTRIPTAMTAAAYARSSGYTPLEASSSAVTVTLDKHYHYTVGYDDSEIGSVGLTKLQNTFIQPAINSIVNQVQSDLFALITSGNYPQVGYSASYANFGFSGLVNAAKYLDASGSNAPRAALLNVNTYYDLLDDIKANYVIGDTAPIRAGTIGSIAGINVAMAPLVGSGVGLAGFVAGKDAAAIAARVPSLAAQGNVQVENVTDPDSGFTVQLRQWYSPDRGMWMVSAIAIYGVAKGNGKSGIRLLTTD